MSTITINGNTFSVQAMPTTPAAPASMEFQHIAVVAQNTNPFSMQMQTLQWLNSAGKPIGYNVTSPYGGIKKVSVSIAAMTNSMAQAWTAFLMALQGPVSVFAFPALVCNLYPAELTLDGVTNSTNPRYFRLQGNSVKWNVAPGIYQAVTFEIAECV